MSLKTAALRQILGAKDAATGVSLVVFKLSDAPDVGGRQLQGGVTKAMPQHR